MGYFTFLCSTIVFVIWCYLFYLQDVIWTSHMWLVASVLGSADPDNPRKNLASLNAIGKLKRIVLLVPEST